MTHTKQEATEDLCLLSRRNPELRRRLLAANKAGLRVGRAYKELESAQQAYTTAHKALLEYAEFLREPEVSEEESLRIEQVHAAFRKVEK